MAGRLGLPKDDFSIMKEKGIWFQPLPIFLYLTAYAIVELASYIAQFKLILLGKLCGGLVTR